MFFLVRSDFFGLSDGVFGQCVCFFGLFGPNLALGAIVPKAQYLFPDRQSGASRVRRSPRNGASEARVSEPSERSGAGAPHTRGGRLSIWPKARRPLIIIIIIIIIMKIASYLASFVSCGPIR